MDTADILKHIESTKVYCNECKWAHSFTDSVTISLGKLKCFRFNILVMPSTTCGSGERKGQ